MEGEIIGPVLANIHFLKHFLGEFDKRSELFFLCDLIPRSFSRDNVQILWEEHLALVTIMSYTS